MLIELDMYGCFCSVILFVIFLILTIVVAVKNVSVEVNEICCFLSLCPMHDFAGVLGDTHDRFGVIYL